MVLIVECFWCVFVGSYDEKNFLLKIGILFEWDFGFRCVLLENRKFFNWVV